MGTPDVLPSSLAETQHHSALLSTKMQHLALLALKQIHHTPCTVSTKTQCIVPFLSLFIVLLALEEKRKKESSTFSTDTCYTVNLVITMSPLKHLNMNTDMNFLSLVQYTEHRNER